ncbi:UbiD family decarboxylase [Paenibacillus zanthoxyli]|uniref:UbiD family decarboxylase n=1 Tax=Paenibacillus zanthoxyli TaxID=369399 RepID=UPI000471AA75|nr:UbiD family decarboxylase [Paenibacillus zanthoxyli]
MELAAGSLGSPIIHDLRSALALMELNGEELQYINRPTQAKYELAAIYAAHGGGVPVVPPTQKGSPILFEQVMPANKPVLAGLFGTRRRCALLLGANERHIYDLILEAVQHPIEPLRCENPPCEYDIQSEVDLLNLPIPTMTPNDAGSYITLGLVVAKHPLTNEINISIHRLWVKSKNELTIWMVPGRHLEQLYLIAKEMGVSLPISINIGLDPAVYFASCCTGSLAPYGFNELSIAGGLRGHPVHISSCLSNNAECISNAEYVLEGEITHEYSREGSTGDHSMPEFLGYNGKAHPHLPIVKISSINIKRDAIFQTVIGPGYEQSNLLAIGMEASVVHFVRNLTTTRIINVYCSSAGGGQLLLFAQFEKLTAEDDDAVRQAGIAIIHKFRMIKQAVLVDEDIDLFSEEDVWWAMATRFQADADIIAFTNLPGFQFDPSQSPGMSPSITIPGMTSKVVFDCTVPYNMRNRFIRTSFYMTK